MSTFRPGGLSLTEHALELCLLPQGASVLDVACGDGDTVEFLRGERKFDACGVDANAPENGKPYIQRAAADFLPFVEGRFDAIFCECSFSLFPAPEAVLREFSRVLKSGGSLIMSDLYARRESRSFAGQVRRLYTKPELEKLLTNCGFESLVFEDHLDEMVTMAAELIMDKGADAFYGDMGGSADEFLAASCSYYLLTARSTKAAAR
jgi:arsenite methyltransferase